MNRTFRTHPDLLPVLRELQAREETLLAPQLGTTEEELDRHLAPDFVEVGASGRCYTREQAKEALWRRYAEAGDAAGDVGEASDWACRALAPDTFLLTYSLRESMRTTRRASVWRRNERGWQAVYHQGTIVV